MKEIFEILNDNGGSIEFYESLTVKMSPHSYPIKITKVFINDNTAFYYDKISEEICKVESDNVIYSIYQRLKLLKTIYKVIK